MKCKWLLVLVLSVIISSFGVKGARAQSCGMGSTNVVQGCDADCNPLPPTYVAYPCTNIPGVGSCMGVATATYCEKVGTVCNKIAQYTYIPCNGGGGGTACGGVYPQCSGACSGGQVCKAIAATGSCNCGTPTSCSDYVPQPNLLSTVRISPTSARFRWRAIDILAYPRVDRIALIVSNDNPIPCLTAAYYNNATAPARCVVYQPDLSPTTTSYTATGALTAGTEYTVILLFMTTTPPGSVPNCFFEDREMYLSSCELTPTPTTVAVGGTRVLTTNLVANTWNVSYTRAPTAYATVTTPDNALPYRTTVTGVADGVVTVTGNVYADATPTTLACSDTATVTVGCVTAAPVAPTLVAPSNGAILSTTDVTLDWNATTDWGTGCPSNSNTYRVYLNESSPPTTQIASVGSGTTASNFTGEFGKTYYWRVGAHNGSLETLSSIRSFTIQSGAAQNAWWQVEGAGVYAGSTGGGTTIASEVPAGNYLVIPGTVGSVAALMRSSGSVDTGAGGISTSAWNALTTYRGKRVDYNYLAAQMGVTYTQANDFASEALDKPVYDSAKDFYFIEPSSGEAHLSSAWSVASGEKYVVFVNGDLRIDQNVTVANGGFLLWVVSGDIIIDPTVSEVEGLMVASGRWVSESSGGVDSQLTVAGSVVGWGGIELNRDLVGAANGSPAERFVYRPDLLITMPDKVKTFVMQWAEVAPGTFGN